MRSRNFLSFGIGLSGLSVALGSVCRPRTTGSSLSNSEVDATSLAPELIVPSSAFSLASTAVTGTTETFPESTATTFETSSAVTNSVDISSTVSVETATVSEDTSLPTTEATTLETSITATTSADISTTTLAETTTTSESPSYPSLFLSASTGPAAGLNLKIDPINLKAPYFIPPGSGHPSTPLSWDPVTGHLLVSDTLSICVAYTRGRQTGQLRVCSSGDVAADYLVCDAPAGPALQCRVRACTVVLKPIPENPGVAALVKECHDEQELWAQFYMRKETLLTSVNADIGPVGISDANLTPMQLLVTEVQVQ